MIRLSEGLRNMMAQGHGFARPLHRGYIEVYSGVQPLSADLTNASYTKLGIITLASGALTKETRATATLTVTGGAATLTNVLVGTLPIVMDPGLVIGVADTTITAGLIRDAINRSGIALASSAANVVTVQAPPGTGTGWNTLALTSTGITCTAGTFSGGLAQANGLYLDQPAAGVISKPAGVVWSCSAIATGTAGWFRFFSSNTSDSGIAITTLGQPLTMHARMDGSCGVGSGDLQLSNLSFVSSPASPHTVDVATFTMPAA